MEEWFCWCGAVVRHDMRPRCQACDRPMFNDSQIVNDEARRQLVGIQTLRRLVDGPPVALVDALAARVVRASVAELDAVAERLADLGVILVERAAELRRQ